MSLDTVWLDTGMPGLCGFQAGGQAGGVVFTQEEPWISDCFPRARKAGQSEALFAALRLPSWLSPFPRTKVSLGGTRLEYPRDEAGTGQEASEVGNVQSSPFPARLVAGTG